MAAVNEAPTVVAAQEIAYTRIIVALDGSALAEGVLPYVEPIARAFGARITLVCALEPIEASFSGDLALGGVGMAGSIEAVYEAHEALGKEDATYLVKVRERLEALGLKADCREPEARAAEAIVTVARQERADLIAMTTHGRSGVGRAVLGSVADHVVRHSPCPVLLVHPR